VANLVNTGGEAVLSLPSHCQAQEVDLIVNARVAMDPAELQRHVQAVVQTACNRRLAQISDAKTQSFRPGRPQPR